MILSCVKEVNELYRRKGKERVVIVGGSMNPPHIPHQIIAMELTKLFDFVYVIPCGFREDKSTTNETSIHDRMEMAKIAFENIPKVRLDLDDLESNIFTPTYLVQEKYQKLHPDAEIWHLIGEDLIAGGCRNNSEIQAAWNKGPEIWNNLNFLIIVRPNYNATADDLPPHSEVIEIEGLVGSGTLIRRLVSEDRPIDGLVDPRVIEYIKEHKLYRRKKA